MGQVKCLFPGTWARLHSNSSSFSCRLGLASSDLRTTHTHTLSLLLLYLQAPGPNRQSDKSRGLGPIHLGSKLPSLIRSSDADLQSWHTFLFFLFLGTANKRTGPPGLGPSHLDSTFQRSRAWAHPTLVQHFFSPSAT